MNQRQSECYKKLQIAMVQLCNDPSHKPNLQNLIDAATNFHNSFPEELNEWDTWDDEGGSIPSDSE